MSDPAKWRVAAAVVIVTLGAACAPARQRRASAPTTSPSTTTTASVATTMVPTTIAERTLKLQEIIDTFGSAQTVSVSVVAVELRTGARAEHLPSRVVLSASLYKLFVARELLRRIADGELSRAASAGDAGRHTVGDCIRLMIVISDNACGAAGLRMVGGGGIDGRLHADGYTGTFLTSPQRTNATDVATFLLKARDHTLLGPGHEAVATELYGLLQQQQVNDRFPNGLPQHTPIAHKTGDRQHWAHDAGVITTPTGDVLLVALSGPWAAPCCDADHPGAAEAAAFGMLASLARRVYEFSAT